MKLRIPLINAFFRNSSPELREGIWLFVERGESYKKLPDAAPVGSVLSNNDVVYFIEDKFFSESHTIPVYYKDEEIGRVGRSWGDGKYDTVLSVKLRLQEQMGFPVASADVKNGQGNSLGNDQQIGSINDRRINVS